MTIHALLNNVVMTDNVDDVNAAFVGKTIRSVDANAVNSWMFHFTDGSSVTLEVENKGCNIYGPAILLED